MSWELEVRVVVVKNGKEWGGLVAVDPGDTIASRHYDAERQCHVVYVLTPGVPASRDVREHAAWDCDVDGHHWVYGNTVCMRCHSTYQPDGRESRDG